MTEGAPRAGSEGQAAPRGTPPASRDSEGQAAPRGTPPASRDSEGQRDVARIGRVLVMLLAPLPWAYGAVHAPVRAAYVVTVALLFAGASLYRIRAGGRPALLDGPTALLLAAVAWAGLALVPLPAAVLQLVSPASWRIAVGNFVDAGLPAPAWHPIAVGPRDAAEAWATAAAHAMVFVLAARALSGRRPARLLAAVIALSGAAMGILAITQQSLGAKRIFFVGLERGQFYGTFVNGNHAATFLAAGALCGLGLLLRERDTGRKLAWGVAGVVSAIGSMYSLSRGGVLALAAGLVVFLLGAVAVQSAARRQRGDQIGRFFQRNAVPLMLTVLAVFYLSWLGPKKIGRELSTLAALDLPKDYRARVWSDSADALADWPITGSGGGTFAHVYPGYRSFPADVTTEMAESDWVQLAVENGLVGFALVAAFGVLLLGRFGAAFLRDPLRFSGAHLGLAAALVTMGGHAMVDFPLRIPAIGALAAAIAGALAGAIHRKRAPVRAERALRLRSGQASRVEALAAGDPPSGTRARRAKAVRPVLLAWVLLPGAAIAAVVYARPREDADALARLKERPADARAWIRLARERDAEAGPLYAVAATLDHGDPAVQRAAALGLARAGDSGNAAAILEEMVELLHESGPQWRGRASELAMDLASQLLFSDPDAAGKVLASADPGPRRSLVAADIAASRAVDAAGTRAAIEAYLAVAGEAAQPGASPIRELARLRALLLTVNAAASLPPAEARAWFDRLARADDPGRVLAGLALLSGEGTLDTKRIWAGSPRLAADDFAQGEPRLVAKATPAAIAAHALESGAERLELRYPEQPVLNDLWLAPLSLRTSEPRLALSARVRSSGRVGDQLCVRLAGGKIVYGTAGEPDANGWRTVTVRGFAAGATPEAPVSVDAWCFDTRGRAGPFFLDDVELFLDAAP